ncbi:MAG: hypothetical protein ACKO5Q_28505, partial [Microcystaceae cyanobacterium]
MALTMIPRLLGYGRHLFAEVKSPVKSFIKPLLQWPGILLVGGGLLITTGTYYGITSWLENTLPVQLEKNLS